MRIVSVNELAKDMVLAREVIDLETERVLLGKGTPVLPQYSERLQKSNINYLYVETFRDGSVAIVLAQNKGFPTRPVVRIFLDAAGRELKAGPEIDLMENNHLLIQ